PAQLPDRGFELQIGGTYVVASRRDAVRLVDGDEPGVQVAYLGEALRLGELLRRDEQEPGAAVAYGFEGGALLRGRLRRAHPYRAEAALGETAALVVLQGEQGRDDQRRARQQGRRYLVDGRLPAAGGQDDEGVPAGQDGAHRGELPVAQATPAEVAARRAA